MGHGDEVKALLFWHSNDDWYEFDDDAFMGVRMKDNAPPEAKASFEKWKKGWE